MALFPNTPLSVSCDAFIPSHYAIQRTVIHILCGLLPNTPWALKLTPTCASRVRLDSICFTRELLCHGRRVIYPCRQLTGKQHQLTANKINSQQKKKQFRAKQKLLTAKENMIERDCSNWKPEFKQCTEKLTTNLQNSNQNVCLSWVTLSRLWTTRPRSSAIRVD